MTPTGTSFRPSFSRVSPERRRGLLALGVAVLTLGALTLLAWPLVRTLISPFAPSAMTADAREQSLKRFAAGLESHRAQFDGRSIFFTPPRPPPPPRPVVDDGPRPPPTPVLPSTYGGPAVIAMINGGVWLADGSRLSAESPEASGVRLVSVSAPWSAKLRWKEVEFDVDLFQRDRIVIKPASNDPAPSSPGEGPATTPQGGTPPAASDIDESTTLPNRDDASAPSTADPGVPAAASPASPTPPTETP